MFTNKHQSLNSKVRSNTAAFYLQHLLDTYLHSLLTGGILTQIGQGIRKEIHQLRHASVVSEEAVYPSQQQDMADLKTAVDLLRLIMQVIYDMLLSREDLSIFFFSFTVLSF
jgi:hypothetical protein